VATNANRYDGHADWYDENFGPLSEEESLLAEVLAPGEESLRLNVACGIKPWRVSWRHFSMPDSR